MKVYTIATHLALVGIAAAAFAAGDPQGALVIFLLTLILPVIGLAFAVRGFEVTQGKLLVHRFGRDTEIDLHELIEVTPAPKLVRTSLSLWSTRGVWGFIGYGYSTATGTYRAYITDSARAVLLRFTTGKIVVVSPDRVDQFLEAVKEAAPPLDPREATAPKPIDP